MVVQFVATTVSNFASVVSVQYMNTLLFSLLLININGNNKVIMIIH